MRRLLLASVLTLACGAEPSAPTGGWTTLPQAPYRTLAEWHLFEGSGVTQQPAEGVMAYEVIAPLFSDHTWKYRFVAIPSGARITWRPEGTWELPVGAVLVKTFAYPRDARSPTSPLRLLETRIIVKTREGFIPHTYVWNEAQTEAVRQVAAPPVQVSWIDEMGVTQRNEYVIPNTNQCLTCHGQRGVTAPLAMRNDQLDRVGAGGNQVDAMAARGWFDVAPPPAAMRSRFAAPGDETAEVAARARAYLHANCGHCHNPRDTSTASMTGLNLEASETTPVALGVCRRPAMAGAGAGGLSYDVVPGQPERSILLFRMRTTSARDRMPSLGLNFNDAAGASLVERWIRGMSGAPCDP
jgi:uncharacterized repeat protein (TIGR03806 family)